MEDESRAIVIDERAQVKPLALIQVLSCTVGRPANTAVSVPCFDVTKLLDTHPVHMRQHAATLFRGDKVPPFVILKGRIRGQVQRKTVVISSRVGRRPNKAVRAELVKRTWNAKYDFWTLDVNGRRRIVAYWRERNPTNRCQLSGYHLWLYGRKFSHFPTALSDIYRAPTVHTDFDKTTIEDFEQDDNEDEDMKGASEHVRPSNTLRGGRHFRLEDPETESARLSSGRQLSTADGNILLVQAQQAFAEDTKDEKKCFELSDSFVQAAPQRPLGTNTVTTCILVPSQVQETLTAPRTLTSSGAAASLPAGADSHPTPMKCDPSAPLVLTEYKGNRTSWKLRVEKPRIRGHSEIQRAGSKRLSSCNTIESFLEMICRKCNITEASIANVAITFPWLSQGHQHREIRLDYHVECMKTLIREVDAAPCWEDYTNHCILPVLVVQKRDWDEHLHQATQSARSQH